MANGKPGRPKLCTDDPADIIYRKDVLGQSFSTIARELGVSHPTVGKRYREALDMLGAGLITLPQRPPVSTAPIHRTQELEGAEIDFAALPDDCGYSKSYQGYEEPRCNGGVGCQACWAKYRAVQGRFISPSKVHEAKAAFEISFDEGMARYREWIGMDNYQVRPPAPRPSVGLRGVILNDLHAPYHDEEQFRRALHETCDRDLCVVIGDLPDWKSFSRYFKYRQHFTAVQELRGVQAVLTALSETYPQVLVVKGNHDERVRKYFQRIGVPSDIIEFLLALDPDCASFRVMEKLCSLYPNVEVVPGLTSGFADYEFVHQIGDMVVGHPETYSKIPNKAVGDFIHALQSKFLPQGLIQPFRVAVMGHTHQAGKTWNDYGVVGIEAGCLCLVPDYDADPRLRGAQRPLAMGYTIFEQDADGITDRNATHFIELS